MTKVFFGAKVVAWKSMQNAFSGIFYTLRHIIHAKYMRKVVMYENIVRCIYLTTVLCLGEGRKYAIITYIV